MSDWYWLFTKVILVTVIVGLIRVFRGPTRADRILAAQLCGTASVAMILMVMRIVGRNYLYDLALVFAILAAVSTIAFVRLTWQDSTTGEEL